MKSSVESIRGFISDFLDSEPGDFEVGPTTELRHGDLTTNVAMVAYSKLLEKYSSPRDLAEAIVEKLSSERKVRTFFGKIEVAGPGFINFWYRDEFLGENLRNFAVSKDLLPIEKKYEGKKVMVEFTDPNPFKEFHIGHLYSNIVGESISRIVEVNGAEVRRVCYQGDVGLHVAKSLYGIFAKLKIQISNLRSTTQKEKFLELEKRSLEERVKFLGESYAYGATQFEENEDARGEIIEINKKVFEKDSEVMGIYEKGRAWSLEYFDTIYKRLGTEFWKLYFESEVGARGKKIVEENVGEVFEKSEEAIIFPGVQYGLHNRVFVNSLGLPTYEAKELGLAPTKYDDYKYDLSIIVTGNEVDEYFRVLLKVLSLIYPDLADRTKHISHGMVRLPGGKMSSRTGNVLTGESMLDEAKNKAGDRIKDLGIKTEEGEDVAEKVGVGAVKYALLKNSIGHDVIFDFGDVVNFEGNSGPYLQYSYVRIRGVLSNSKFKIQNLKLQFKIQNLKKEEEELLRYLMLYPYVLSQAGENFSPSTVATYLYDLCQKFNVFYQKNKIIGGENEKFRLTLCAACGNILENGFWVLGMETVERM